MSDNEGNSFCFRESPDVGKLRTRGKAKLTGFQRDLTLRASLCKIVISSFAHKMDFAHNFSVDFF